MKTNKTNIAWFLVILGGIVELFWVSGLKLISTHHGHLTDKDLAANLDKDLHLNELFSGDEK